MQGKEINRLKCEMIPTAISTQPLNEHIYLIGLHNIIYAWDSRTSKICKKYESKMEQVCFFFILVDK